MVGTSCCHSHAYIQSATLSAESWRPHLQEQAPDMGEFLLPTRRKALLLFSVAPFTVVCSRGPGFRCVWQPPSHFLICVWVNPYSLDFSLSISIGLDGPLGSTETEGNRKRFAWATWGLLGFPPFLPCPCTYLWVDSSVGCRHWARRL